MLAVDLRCDTMGHLYEHRSDFGTVSTSTAKGILDMAHGIAPLFHHIAYDM